MIASPIVLLDARRRYLHPAITCSRGSSKRVWLPTGLLGAVKDNAPAWDCDPATGEERGARVDETRTNLLLQSGALASAPWSGDAAPTDAAAVAPDGTQTAVLLDAVAAERIWQQVVSVPADATARTFSVHLKPASAQKSRLRYELWNGSGRNISGVATMDWAAKTITNDYGCLAVHLEALPYGWYRAGVTGADSLATGFTCRVYPAGPSATGSVYVWGAQAETGATPGRYTPTTTAQVTGAADVVTLALASLPQWRADEGTLLVEAALYAKWTTFPPLWQVSDGTTANRIAMLFNGGVGKFNPYLTVSAASASQADFPPAGTTDPQVGVPFRVGASWAKDDFAVCQDGGSVYSDGLGVVPTGLTTLRLGGGNGGLAPVYLRRVLYWPRRSAPSSLQYLTA